MILASRSLEPGGVSREDRSVRKPHCSSERDRGRRPARARAGVSPIRVRERLRYRAADGDCEDDPREASEDKHCDQFTSVHRRDADST
jgi:hypothetical protein